MTRCISPLGSLVSIVLLACAVPASASTARTPWIEASQTGDGFVRIPSGERFVPWGFNYSRDERFRLIEDYWADEGADGWAKVERDFRAMKRLGANVVRINLQLHQFMEAPGKPARGNLSRLERLIGLAEELGLYLDVTGLGTFRAAEVPAWYRELDEADRWAVQAQFWEAVAKVGAGRPGVFAYNLMNEPLVSTERRPPGEWTAPTELEGLRYIEFINLDPAGRSGAEIARAWIRQMTRAIRAHDDRHPITVGLIQFPGVDPDNLPVTPAQIAAEVDFMAVHVYPEAGKVDAALGSLARYRHGKPVLIEETFPMNCSPAEYADFLQRSRGLADGWLAHFWSLAPEDLKGKSDIPSSLMLASLETFQALDPNRPNAAVRPPGQ